MSKRKLTVWLPLLLSISMVVGMYMGYKMGRTMPGKSFFYKETRRPLQEVMDLIKSRYVDEVDLQALSDTAIEAILAGLDPHSEFIPATDVDQRNDEINGSFYGIGIEFSIISDTLHVINVLKDGPSFKAGLKTGDKIIKAGDSIISGKKISIDRVRKLLKGALGTTVRLDIIRNNQPKTVDIPRGLIPLTSVDAAYMIDTTTGYIRLNKFSTQTYREFMESLIMLKKKGLQKLVLDLRDNGGGVLEEAVEIADEFLEGDKLITYTEGLHTAKKEYRCRREGQFEKGALVILADEGTASASEILIGALQDWDRATIVGRRTFGKGLVLDQFNLSDNSALRLTIARYYTPVGRSIQRSYAKGGRAYYEDFYNRSKMGELVSADSIKNDTTKIFHTMGGKKIYGGGGITPDYFVAADTAMMGITTAKLFSRGIINDYAYRYYLGHLSISDTYKTADDFVKRFTPGEDAWQLLETMAAKDSIPLGGISASEKSYLQKALKSNIARQLFRLEGYFEAVNEGDNSLKKALEILRK
jgi:carboxyl-terminal processing protease